MRVSRGKRLQPGGFACGPPMLVFESERSQKRGADGWKALHTRAPAKNPGVMLWHSLKLNYICSDKLIQRVVSLCPSPAVFRTQLAARVKGAKRRSEPLTRARTAVICMGRRAEGVTICIYCNNIRYEKFMRMNFFSFLTFSEFRFSFYHKCS